MMELSDTIERIIDVKNNKYADLKQELKQVTLQNQFLEYIRGSQTSIDGRDDTIIYSKEQLHQLEQDLDALKEELKGEKEKTQEHNIFFKHMAQPIPIVHELQQMRETIQSLKSRVKAKHSTFHIEHPSPFKRGIFAKQYTNTQREEETNRMQDGQEGEFKTPQRQRSTTETTKQTSTKLSKHLTAIAHQYGTLQYLDDHGDHLELLVRMDAQVSVEMVLSPKGRLVKANVMQSFDTLIDVEDIITMAVRYNSLPFLFSNLMATFKLQERSLFD